MPDENDNSIARRGFLKATAATGLAALSGSTRAQAFDFNPNQRYPDPSLLILDPSFARYRVHSSTLPQGKAVDFIKLPERCANLTFGGPKNNRLCMASSHSPYALFVEAHGAT